MKKILGLMMAAALMAGAATVYAGSGCCPASKAKAEAKGGCADSFSGLKLSAEQKAKLDVLTADCEKTQCSKTAHEKLTAGVKEILTAEQYADWKAQCEKKQASGACPYTSKK
jgi:hypothetical protein